MSCSLICAARLFLGAGTTWPVQAASRSGVIPKDASRWRLERQRESGDASAAASPRSVLTEEDGDRNTTRLTFAMTAALPGEARVGRVQRPPDRLPADRVAEQGDLAVRRLCARDRVVDDLADVAYPDVGAREADIARVGAPLPGERIDVKSIVPC